MPALAAPAVLANLSPWGTNSTNVDQMRVQLDEVRRTIKSLIGSFEVVVGEVRELGLMVRVDTNCRIVRVEQSLGLRATAAEGQQKLGFSPPMLSRATGAEDVVNGSTPPRFTPRVRSDKDAELHEMAAASLQAKADYEGALREYKQVLDLRQADVGPVHPKVGDCHYAMALTYDLMKSNAEALPCYKQALQIFTATLGDTHAKVGATWYSMGLAYHTLAEWEKAREAYEQALSVLSQALGEDNPAVANICNNMAVALHAENKATEAMQFHQRAMRCRIACYGGQHKKVGDSHYNMAAMIGFEEGSDLESAKKHYESCYVIYKAHFGPEHAETVDVAGRIRHLMKLQKKRTLGSAAKSDTSSLPVNANL
eukprot:NODE_7656_length_1560_cov_6.958130.p1 GENE.NODE_7656_length_1560_cov_6.958130~~NODE_7656_length_1560_cov_6.958130.p1  ORF type:complete len:424 (-),score=112.87 NODE_7656_length_1560_cov_6.958130:289-1395(-)